MHPERVQKLPRWHQISFLVPSRVLRKDDDPQAKDGLGVLYLNTGRATQAEKLFREALERVPNDPTLKLHLVSEYTNVKATFL